VAKEKKSKPSEGLPVIVVQVLAWVVLIVLFVADRVMQKIVPPLHDGWYAALFSVAAFGRGFKKWLDAGDK